jgi:hypothetical protein
MQMREAADNACRNMAMIEAAKPTMREAGQGLMAMAEALPEQPYQALFLGQEWNGGKVRPVRRMDRVEWTFSILVCAMVEALPVALTAQAWISYGMLAGLAVSIVPLLLLMWLSKVVWDRETKGE